MRTNPKLAHLQEQLVRVAHCASRLCRSLLPVWPHHGQVHVLLEKELELAGGNGGVLGVRRNDSLCDGVFNFVLVNIQLE